MSQVQTTRDHDQHTSSAYEVRLRGHGTEVIRLADGDMRLLQGDEAEEFFADEDDVSAFDASCAALFKGN